MMPVTFESWVDYCFTSGGADRRVNARTLAQDAPFQLLSPNERTTFLIRLFESPEFVAAKFTREQIADGVWAIFGMGIASFEHVRDAQVPKTEQARCYRAIANVYRTLFDPLCRDASDREVSMRSINADPLECAIYMIWDMNCVEVAAMSDEFSYLVESCFQVLQTALGCNSAACKISALHGLGHLAAYHPKRVAQMAGSAAKNKSLPKWICEYAEQASEGGVQ